MNRTHNIRDVLPTLRAARKYVRGLVQFDDDTGFPNPGLKKVLRQIEAAIAKARGNEAAAAPELLDALQAAAGRIAGDVYSPGEGEFVSLDLKKLLDRVDAAIAKFEKNSNEPHP